MIRVLITGVAGNIGSALAHRLLETGRYHIIGVDNLLTGSRAKLPLTRSERFEFYHADVNDRESISRIMHQHHSDVVFHYAAVVGVKRTLENPLMVLADIQGIKNILELSKETDVLRVVFSSSSEVYGEPFEIPQHELTTPLNSRLPYAVVKNVGEVFVRSFHQAYGLDFTIFRFFNTYGPAQSDDFVITRFIKQAMSGKDITIYGDGTQTRTFCFVDDNVEATINCLEKSVGINDILNIGSDREISILDLAKLILNLTGSSSQIKHLPPLLEGDMSRRCPDNSKMRSILGRPLTSLEEGIKKTVQHLKA